MDRLLFANVPHDYNHEDLRTWIEDRGLSVDGIKMIRDAVSGSSPSFARVKLNTAVDDGTIDSLNQQTLGNRRVFVRRGRSPLDD